MIPPPIVLGLTICEKVIIEEGTRNVTIVSTFTRLLMQEFPSPPQRFSMYCVLTEGLGDATILLTVTNVETDEEVDRIERSLRFPDRLVEVRLLFQIRECSFPVEGTYLITLYIDGEWLAQRRLQVRERQSCPRTNNRNRRGTGAKECRIAPIRSLS
jgi:hypothetical protein